jgi:hypothetical protein
MTATGSSIYDDFLWSETVIRDINIIYDERAERSSYVSFYIWVYHSLKVYTIHPTKSPRHHVAKRGSAARAAATRGDRRSRRLNSDLGPTERIHTSPPLAGTVT